MKTNIQIRAPDKVVYPESSYAVIGAAFKVFNDIGYGASEKLYQRALARVLEQEGISFERERMVEVAYRDKLIGRCFLDFIVDKKIVVELKVRPKFGYTHIKQVVDYLKTADFKLAMLIYFTREGVKYR